MKSDEHSKGKITATWVGVLAASIVLLGATRTPAVPPPTGVAPVVVPAGGFDIDGDLLANAPVSGIGDWLGGTNAGGGGAVLDAGGRPINPNTTFHFADPFDASDLTFVGGLKWGDDPGTWQWTSGKASSKVNINNVLLHVSTDTNGHSWVVIAADRASTSGDSYIDFEFLQSPLYRTSNNTFSSLGPNGGRTANDVLLSLAFTSGGSVPDFFAWRWQTNGSGGFAYVDATAALPIGGVFLAANSKSISVPYGAFGSTTYTPNGFAEAAIDLTALVSAFDPCLSIGVQTIMVKTKTSASSSATIVDFIDPIQYTMRLGPAAVAGPAQKRCIEGDTTTFPLNGKALPGLYPIVSTQWSVVSGSATIDDPASLTTIAHVSTNATLRLTAVQANGCTETDEIILTVLPLPVGAISGPAVVCPNSSRQFQGTPGMSGYAWSIAGNGSITGAANGATVTVVAGPACATGYTLSLNVTSNTCVNSCSYEVQVNDTNAPSIHCPADVVLECPADTGTNRTGVATAQDDCGTVVVSYSDSVTNGCGGTRVIARTWVAADQCGNTTQSVQWVTVRNTVRPSLTVPANVVLECPADTGTNNTGAARAMDGCGGVTVSYSDGVSNGCGGTRVISRLWTAVDECGNGTNGLQVITVRDSTAPTLNVPADVALECPADTGTNNVGVATAQDGCGEVTVSYSDTVSNSCAGTKIIWRRWAGVDECGNSANRVQTITVRDTTSPSLTLPADLVLECPADTSTNNTGVATGEDLCGALVVTYHDSVSNNCGGTKVISRKWVLADECGNQTNGVQMITVRDTVLPSITAPADVVLECPANTSTNNTGVATAQDGCSAVTVIYSDAVSNSCAGTKLILRTWSVSDGCGNIRTVVQRITVRDTSSPTLTVPTDVVLECPADTTTNKTGVAVAQDGCGSVIVSFNDVVTNGCAGAKVVARMWTATDTCGNTRNGLQTITVRDTTAPLLSAPQDLVLECPADTRTNATGVATAQDSCGAAAISYSDSVSNNCGGTKVISRLWTATDACGNSHRVVQTIAVRDGTRPSLVIPADRVLECPADTRTNVTGVATAEDGCGSVTVIYNDNVSNNCGGTKVILRTWAAADACGNATNRVQTITVRDTTAPSLVLPANLVLECPGNTSTNNTGAATAQDGCGSVIVSYSDSISNACGGTKVVFRNWAAVDQCGNSTNRIQQITVRDTTPPTLSAPPNVVLECPSDVSTNFTGIATAQDGCGQVAITFSDATTDGCGATRAVVRTWVATDQCGNTARATQTITVRDTTRPTILVPADLVLECPADTGTNATGVATGQDTCGQVTIRYSDSVSNGCANTKVISRTWTATDACGNSTTGLQKVTVRDTLAPTVTAPLDLVLECGASTAPSATGTATAQDGCGNVTFTYSDSISNLCGGSRIISRTWTASDACGNRTNVMQKITVQDTTPPALKLPANLVLQCPGDTRTSVTGVATAPDVCGSAVVTYSDVVTNGCGATRTVLRLWTAVDQCGNSTNGLQTINVVDTQKPAITCRNISVQCAGDVPAPYADRAALIAAGGTASDSCDANPTFALMSDSGLIGSCPGEVTRVYRLTDTCGNYGEATHTITVDDTIAPVLACPSNMVVECGVTLELPDISTVKATDNCDTNVVITFSDSVVPSQYSIKWYAADQQLNSGPYQPTYLRFGPGSLPCPDDARLTGRAADPLRNAVAYGPTSDQLDALTSMGAEPMAMGQVVPFEAVIEVAGGSVRPENGTIEFTTTWSTHTTSNDEFGYDKNYKVYCAFVDTADPGLLDPENNARVESYSAVMVNTGTIDEKIQGTFRVSGLNSGDRVVVEIWVVLMATSPRNFGGTIASDLIGAQKATTPPQPLSTGNQTVSIGSLSKIATTLPPPQQQPPPHLPTPQPAVPPGCTVTVIDRTWRATDDCGNQSTCAQRITLRDTTAPAIIAPDVVLEFPAETGTNVTGTAQISDDCTPSVINFTDVVTLGCGGTRTVARTWTAMDACGNVATNVQTIQVRDSTAPTLTVPADVTLEYPANVSPSATGSATATDLSGTPVITYSDAVTTNCGNTIVIARHWLATDACGNTNDVVQTITVRDTTAPAIIAPPSLVLECPANLSTNATGTPTAQDAAGAVTLSFSDVVTTNCGSTKALARTWTATDECGNTATAIQTITVRDTIAPQVALVLVEAVGTNVNDLLQFNYLKVFPDGLTIGLPAAEHLFWAPDSAGVAALESAIADTGGSIGRLTQSATNSVSTLGGGELARQAVLLTLNAGFNTAGVLGMGPNNFAAIVYTAAGDALSGLSVTQILDSANRALADGSLPSGYTFSSLAGLLAEINTSFEGRTTSVWAKAHLATPAIVVECAAQVPVAAPSWVVVSDGCSLPVSVTSLADVISEYACPGRYTITRTWVGRDACGNSSSASCTIRVNDTTAPTLVINTNRTVSGDQSWEFDEPLATDNCGPVTLRIVATVTNLTSGNGMIAVRTWEAADQCALLSTCQQTVTVENTVPKPAITSVPECRTGGVGGNTTLSVLAGGTGPFTYQWQLNGQNLSGATGSSLRLTGLQFTNAGVYTVLVANGVGSVSSPGAIVDVLPTLALERAGTGIRLTWPAPFTLQAASSPTGVYADVPGASSPYLDAAVGNAQRFFRLRAQPFALRMTSNGAGQRGVEITGVPGLNFILQGSTNLVDWANLQTNTAPSSFIDLDAANLPGRYYRVVLALARLSGEGTGLEAPVISGQPVSQTLGYGNQTILSVAASGSGPLNYQWRLNGANISGATGSTLALKDSDYADAGLYAVLVSNGAGAVTSSVAVVNVSPKLEIGLNGNRLSLTWEGRFVLQSASSPAGPFQDVAGATSPYGSDAVGAQAFFRLRAETPNLTSTILPNGQTSITVTGSLGTVYLLQASADLVHWTTLSTSTVPCTFVDTTTMQSSRFYRTILAK